MHCCNPASRSAMASRHDTTEGLTRLVFIQVAAFQCLQPFVGAVLAVLVLGEEASIWDLGAIGVIAGLVLIAKDPGETTAMLNKLKRIVSHQSLAK